MRRRFFLLDESPKILAVFVVPRSRTSGVRQIPRAMRRRRRVKPKPVVVAVAQDSAVVANEAFLAAIDANPSAPALTASAVSYLKLRLREESFARKIMMPVAVTKVEVGSHS